MGSGKSKPSLKPEELADLRQQTFFSDQEIQEWYKGFIRDCPSGKIDATEFKIMYQNIFPEGDPSAFSDHVFRSVWYLCLSRPRIQVSMVPLP